MADALDMEGEGFSLADLAGLDVSDIEEVRFTPIALGIYDWKVIAAELAEDEKDGERRFKAEFELEVLEAKAILEPGVTADDMKGKKFTERYFMKPTDSQEDIAKSIGRIRAFVADIGCDNKGPLGQIVANTKDHTFTAKIKNRPNKDDPTNPYKSLVLDQKK